MMKRFLAFVLAFLIILCTFSACGSSKTDETEKQGEEQKDEKAPDNSVENKEENKEENNEAEENSSPSAEEGGDSESSSDSGDGGNIPEKHPEDYYAREGKKITFGSYPQTHVTDDSLISVLNFEAGILPTDSNSRKWTSYGYYTGNKNDTDFMWYIDVTQGSEKYRGVYFVSYRPFTTSYAPNASTDAREGFGTGKTYWFKYEPLTWTVLSENETEGTALVLCDKIIDSQAYQNNYVSGSVNNTISDATEKAYVNSYAYSTIRNWLNTDFYNTAFNEFEQWIIRTSQVDNSAATTNSSTNLYACANTEDKIFLLSLQDTLNEEYGFSPTKNAVDTARQKEFTDYAFVQGIYEHPDQTYKGKGFWWLRSPSDTVAASTCLITCMGGSNSTGYVNSVNYGVVPALSIRLK